MVKSASLIRKVQYYQTPQFFNYEKIALICWQSLRVDVYFVYVAIVVASLVQVRYGTPL